VKEGHQDIAWKYGNLIDRFSGPWDQAFLLFQGRIPPKDIPLFADHLYFRDYVEGEDPKQIEKL